MINNPGRRGMRLAGKAKRAAIAAGTLTVAPRRGRGIARPCPGHCRTTVLALPLLAGGSIVLEHRQRPVGIGRGRLSAAAAYVLTTPVSGPLSTHVAPVDVDNPPAMGYRRHDCPNATGR